MTRKVQVDAKVIHSGFHRSCEEVFQDAAHQVSERFLRFASGKRKCAEVPVPTESAVRKLVEEREVFSTLDGFLESLGHLAQRDLALLLRLQVDLGVALPLP